MNIDETKIKSLKLMHVREIVRFFMKPNFHEKKNNQLTDRIVFIVSFHNVVISNLVSRRWGSESKIDKKLVREAVWLK